MEVHKAPCRPSEGTALAGLALEHDLHLALGDWTSWEAVAELLHGAGAEVQSLHLSRQGGGFSVRCRLKCLSPEPAHAITGDFALDVGPVHRASVEHLVLAKRAAGEAA